MQRNATQCRHYQARQHIAKQRTAVPSNDINAKQCEAMQRSTKQYQAIRSNAQQCRTMRNRAYQCNTMLTNAKQCHAIAKQCDCNAMGHTNAK
eukprot:5475221-Pyramimonas_sp.AAC.1